ncbi:hypothetical protein Z043_111379 [Scleropages formosus]|uniref:Mitochondrial S-adenosylmethionine carrier protein n=1 Tax=Scleropages formosus TaxID=113540 RepID=A0A0P7YPK2_SCLFO|nr:hypothetical protein Z043_111379 [Scleropages formosus]
MAARGDRALREQNSLRKSSFLCVNMDRREFTASLVAGGCAGMCVDLTLFPLDTIKTRLQSQRGFSKAGGFRGIYAGVPSAAVGSFPNAAAFFVTYEATKSLLRFSADPRIAPLAHMIAASLGEIVACLIRVPTEVVKQRAQASLSSSTLQVLLGTLREEGLRGLYRGYQSTVLREVRGPHLHSSLQPTSVQFKSYTMFYHLSVCSFQLYFSL